MSKNYVIIKDFLPIDIAEDLGNHIQASKKWHHVHKLMGKLPKYIPLQADYNHVINQLQPKLQKSLYKGKFTYKMRRVEKCTCGECPICLVNETVLKSPDFINYLEAMSGIEGLELLVSFGSIYDRGDFLSTHPDPRYDIAFILNLTKDWKYEYGGCLTVFDEGLDASPTVILPEFNTMVLMFLGDKGVPHYVSEVAQTAPHPRIAISGWYNRNSS